MTLIVRANYSQETIVLLAHLSQQGQYNAYKKKYAVYIETGWGAEGWLSHVERGERLAKQLGFIPIRLSSPASFESLMRDRGDFPSQKFQWCAGMLKDIPLINWLDEHDPTGEWVIAIPKRQALARTTIPEVIHECPYHGDRKVIHPILHLTEQDKADYLAQYSFQDALVRSLECEPCVNLRQSEIAELKYSDIEKTFQLEKFLQKTLFPTDIKSQVQSAKECVKEIGLQRDSFNRGCGDPFGCGL
jgi:3'-phosphoadenosine 5'-phosphosulfate sulfotransferase (PAPS reductase)/FAD synthetase